MNRFISSALVATLTTASLFAAACGDGDSAPCATIDGSPSGIDAAPTGVTFHQVEQLARPGINEALLLTNGFLAGYNTTAPTFAGVDPATLVQVAGEAKTVLKAVYLGSCLLNGVLGLSAASGVKPAGLTCAKVGGAVFTEGTPAGTHLDPTAETAAGTYADKVFNQFEPDVMRIDTAVASGYLTLCGDASSTPLLCGGRLLNDDVIDVTYNYLINGAGTTKGGFDQVRALTGDGVQFSQTNEAENTGSVNTITANPQQGHPSVSTTFPYGAPPI